MAVLFYCFMTHVLLCYLKIIFTFSCIYATLNKYLFPVQKIYIC